MRSVFYRIYIRAGFLNLEASMSLVSLVEWNVSLGSADVSWGGVRAIRTAAKGTSSVHVTINVFFRPGTG